MPIRRTIQAPLHCDKAPPVGADFHRIEDSALTHSGDRESQENHHQNYADC